MISWRISMTILTDLSASMFAACFMILLIFLSLVQRHEAQAPAPPHPIEATQAFALTRQQALAPSAMVDHLFAHGQAGTDINLDLFADRVELREPGGGPARRLATGDFATVAADLGKSGAPVRLHVFSNALYNQLVGQIEASGAEFTELTVAAGLRDPGRPDLEWAPEFLQLGETAADLRTFRIGLAALLQGAADRIANAQAAAAGQSAMAAQPPGIVERLRRALNHFAQLFFPLAGLASVGWIERRRFGAIHDR